MNEKETKFVDGLFVNKREGSPEFLIASISINAEKFTKWLAENTNEQGFANIDVKRSMKGSIYAMLNDWKPRESYQRAEDGKIETINVDEIPF